MRTENITPKGFKVPPLQIIQIRKIANFVRSELRLNDPYLDVIKLIEEDLTLFGLTYDYVDENIMGTEEHGRSYPNKKCLLIREDVYIGACSGNGRDRFTICHEIGHQILHTNCSFSRSTLTKPHKFYEDSEWQADTFSGEFLMPIHHVKSLCKNAKDIMNQFGVSEHASETRWRKLKEQGVI